MPEGAQDPGCAAVPFNRRDELVKGNPLFEKTQGPCSKHWLTAIFTVAQSHSDDGNRRADPADSGSGFSAVHGWHGGIHQDYIRIQRFCEPGCFLAIGGMANDFKICIRVENQCQNFTDHGPVVRDEDPDSSQGIT
jgi:hypothetical protein